MKEAKFNSIITIHISHNISKKELYERTDSAFHNIFNEEEEGIEIDSILIEKDYERDRDD